MYSVNFSAFYTDKEKKINNEKIDICNKMHDIESYYKFIAKYKINEKELSFEEYINKRQVKGELNNFYSTRKQEQYELKKKLRQLTKSERKKELKTIAKLENKESKKLANKNEMYIKLKKYKKLKNDKLRELLKKFNGIREIRKDSLLVENVISIFDNSLSRTINAKYNEINMDTICITISHYDVMDQIIEKGFTYKDDEGKIHKYRVLTSSAGQIRKKKIVFVDEDVWCKYAKSIMCGLSWERINQMGGMNINKFLAYLALQNSATDIIDGFNIDECIVVDDFENTLKNRTVDYIEKKDKEEIDCKTGKTIKKLVIKDSIRTNKDITITHTDGCGLQLVDRKSFQIRLPFLKGLMTYCNYKKFCNSRSDASPIVTDIWGKEWNIIDDNIKYIFTKSQFKMWKYYTNIYTNEGDEKPFMYGWDVYKACFKAYSCTANFCNKEKNKSEFKNGRFNYQYWQPLIDVTDQEIEYFTNPIVENINNCHDNVKSMLNIFGAVEENTTMNVEQKLLYKYPALLKDFHFQDSLSSKLAKIKKDAKCGKFNINSINTFVIPDVYAWMENLFCGIKEPKGLLEDGEVSCKYFMDKKLLSQRSPMLYREHVVRENVTSENCEDKRKELMKEYFTTNGIYVSSKDLISKISQLDWDGDCLLVTNDNHLINIAERNCKDIVPLYYDMGKAEAEQITTKNIIKSLKSAFKYGNIGIYSNKITNQWNTDKFDDNAMNFIKLLTAMNNYSIDSAKTLEMVELDTYEKDKYKELLKLSNSNMPYFFQFAKDKDKNSVADLNKSTVNRICKEIENNAIDNYNYDFSKVGKFNTRYLFKKGTKVKNIDVESNMAVQIIEKFEKIDKEKNIMFKKAISNNHDKDTFGLNVYSYCKKEFIEYLNKNKIETSDAIEILLKYYFIRNKTSKKTLLINVFGNYILNNLEENLKDVKFGFCEHCGERFEKEKIKDNSTKYCISCAKAIKLKQNRESYARNKEKQKP